ncbi:hypothetical protein [Nocardioides limicola]|uniref:hypothetical protein n=1 Tax=Nocardioides limicola TaxID=2803368 RepID=UPI00193B1003|nr:hypothetical protein [Nocardioides sp. DJM-14]
MALIAALVAVILVGTPAHAGNGHFIKSQTSASMDANGVLTVKFKEAGLSSGSTQDITIGATMNATYACINNGGNQPSDPKKELVTAHPTASGSFPAAKNGHVTGELSLAPVAASDALSCPGGQTSTLLAVSWSNIWVRDEDTGAYLDIPGTFSVDFGAPGKGKGKK